MIGPDLSVPSLDKKLTLGTWQQIVFLELDTRPRDRTVIVQLIGEWTGSQAPYPSFSFGTPTRENSLSSTKSETESWESVYRLA